MLFGGEAPLSAMPFMFPTSSGLGSKSSSRRGSEPPRRLNTLDPQSPAHTSKFLAHREKRPLKGDPPKGFGSQNTALLQEPNLLRPQPLKEASWPGSCGPFSGRRPSAALPRPPCQERPNGGAPAQVGTPFRCKPSPGPSSCKERPIQGACGLFRSKPARA